MIRRGRDERPETQLIELARGGDADAFAELVMRHQVLATRVARVAAPAADLDDVVQEAFVKAWLALPRFRPDAAFRPWLCAIVANEARNRIRSAGRRDALALRAPEPGPGPTDPADAALDRETHETLVAAMNRLASGDRLVIAYRWLFEMSEAEMAVALDVAPGTVKSRLSRAMTRLRTALAEEGTP
ncbi:MAG TPA: sigma-70 family RNA polymerase sigma factor [Actinomycetota bacterium]|nr:sigma-70 family RNA polymerase sigma factor [Actinomycetota bacterium]